MKTLLFNIRLIFAVLILGSCSKKEEIALDSKKNDLNTTKPIKYFIGAHNNVVSFPTVFDLIVGFTYNDGSFERTDSIRGDLYINTNEKHTSTYSQIRNEFYFICKSTSSNNLILVIVNSLTGKIVKTIDLGIIQNEMIHLQFDELGNELYFNMDKTIYTINTSNGNMTNVTSIDPNVTLPSGNFINTSFYITKDKFFYVENDSKLVIYDRNLKKINFVALEGNGVEYRALVANISNYNELFTLSLNGSKFRIDNINYLLSTYSTMELEDANCNILWYQARFHNKSLLYSCLPFDHQSFPYFILINPFDGKINKYNSPSHVGQCLLK